MELKDIIEITIVEDEHAHDSHQGMKLFLVEAEDKWYNNHKFTTGFRTDRTQEQGMFSNGLNEPMQVIEQEEDGWHFSMCMMGELSEKEIDELLEKGEIETNRFKLKVIRSIFGEGYITAMDHI